MKSLLFQFFMALKKQLDEGRKAMKVLVRPA